MSEASLVNKTVSRLSAKKPVHFQINALTKQGRKQLMQVLSEFFEKEGLNKAHAFPIHYALVEILFNAIKANLKFVAFREEIKKQLDRFKINEIEDLLQVIIEERTLREFMATRVLPDILRNQVQKIFDLEEKYRTGMGQRLTPEQVELLKKFRLLVRSIDAEVKLEISNSQDDIRITVKNNVPMLGRDLERIQQSRLHHAADPARLRLAPRIGERPPGVPLGAGARLRRGRQSSIGPPSARCLSPFSTQPKPPH